MENNSISALEKLGEVKSVVFHYAKFDKDGDRDLVNAKFKEMYNLLNEASRKLREAVDLVC